MNQRILCCGVVAAILGIGLVSGFVLADPPTTAPAKPATAPARMPPQDPAVAAPKGGEDSPQRKGFMSQHEALVKLAKAGNVDVMFLGDSITAGWAGPGKDVWTKTYAPLHAGNFGIGGDQTQHVLWRIDNGETVGIHPKVVVLMIGTNNLGSSPSNDIVAGGVKAVVADLRQKLPEAKILLLGIFPRDVKATSAFRQRIKAINAIIAKLDDGKTIRYLDIGDKFLADDGSIAKEVMGDALHPTAKGYQIWADAMRPTLEGMLK